MPEWLGIHYLRVKSTLGIYNPDPDAQGYFGLYHSVYSDPIKLTILDPCRNSTVNLIEPLITEIAVPVGKSKQAQVLAGPTDSMSVFYGNGYDRCGPMIYDLIFVDGVSFDVDLFDQKLSPVRPTNADILEWELSSEMTGT